jgi:alkylhydroperoxidase family enzyme
MALVPLLTVGDLTEQDRDVLARDINLYRALAHSPVAARAISDLGKYIRFQSRIDARLRELAIIQVTYSCAAAYAYAHHIKIGFQSGVSKDDVRQLIDDTNGLATSLDPVTKTVLRAAREMTATGKVGVTSMGDLARHFEPGPLTDLLLTIGFYNFTARYSSSIELDLEDEYRPYLDAYPLPGANAATTVA